MGKPEQYPRKVLPCKSGKSIDEQGEAYARLMTSPEFAAYRVIDKSMPGYNDKIDIPTMMQTLCSQAEAVHRGDLRQAEAMLMNQAVGLQTLFTHLTERGLSQSQMPNLEAFMRLALRAQSQCRTTLEALAAIKNPPVIFAKQVNQTTGPQQINNGSTHSQAQQNENDTPRLSERKRRELHQDTGTPGLTGQIDSTLEAVGAIDRAKDTRRQSAVRHER